MNTFSFPYLQLVEKLKNELAFSNSKVGDSFQSAQNIVDKYSVAYVTARKAVDVLIEEGILAREPGCKPRIARLPEMSKDAVKFKPSDRTIAIIAGCSVMNPIEWFTSYVYRLTTQALDARGFNHITSLIMHSSDAGALVDKIIHSGFVNGVIVCCQYLESIAQHLEAARFPAVFIDYVPKLTLVDSVNVNNTAAAMIALKKLTELGHRRIDFVGHLNGGMIQDDAREIRDGWASLMGPLGFIGRAHLIGNLPNEPHGEEAVESIFDARPYPTALFVSNPHSAQTLKTAIEKAGIRVPDDVSIVCVSGEFIKDFPISHINQSWGEIAELSVDRLADRLQNDISTRVRINCIGDYAERETTRDYREVVAESEKSKNDQR